MGVRLCEVRTRRQPSGLNAESGKRLGWRVRSAEVRRARRVAGGWGRGGRDVRWGVDSGNSPRGTRNARGLKNPKRGANALTILVSVRLLGGFGRLGACGAALGKTR